MSGLTKGFLEEIGVPMSDEHFIAFSKHFDNTLQDHIIDHIIDYLNETSMQEFAKIDDAGDNRWEWLTANVPEIDAIIKQEVDIMLAEVIRSSDHL